MKAAKMTLTATILAAAFGLALGLAATPAQAHHCKGAHDFPDCEPGGGGAGGGGGGGTTPIVAEIMDIIGSDLVDDGGPYSDSERDVKANVGPGVFIGLRGTGNDPREVTVFVACDDTLIGDCSLLPIDAFGVQRAKVFLAARPYAVNCPDPDPDPDGECLDVFSLSDEAPAEMGFTVVFDEGIRLDIASAIGGTTAKNPGRCLSNMTDNERHAFLDAYCGADEENNPNSNDFTDCNVTVTAHASVLDGPNDSWNIVAANDTGLICNFFPDVFVIGVATGVTFEIQADVE